MGARGIFVPLEPKKANSLQNLLILKFLRLKVICASVGGKDASIPIAYNAAVTKRPFPHIPTVKHMLPNIYKTLRA